MRSAIVACCSKAGLAVIRTLGEHGIALLGLCFGRGQVGAASRFLRERRWCTDPSEDENAFINDLLEIDAEWNGSALIPTDDGTLVAISRHRQRLEARFRVVCEPWETVVNLIEKDRTYAIAERHGIPCPRLRLVSNEEETLQFAAQIGYPCLLKPCVGHLFFKRHRQKMLMVKSEAELREHLKTILSCGEKIMLCEYIPGGDSCGINYNSFALAGEPVAEFTAAKVRNRPTLIGFPTVVRSAAIPDVKELGRAMLRALKLNDFSCMEFKRDPRDGVCKLMEVNARHNYSGALAHACGINFPLLSFERAMGQPLPAMPAQPSRDMFWIDEERDLRHMLASLTRGKSAAFSALNPYRAPKVFAVSRKDDLAPSLALMKSSVSFALSRQRAKH